MHEDEQWHPERLYREFCKVWHRDPEDLDSILLYEGAVEAWMDENCRRIWEEAMNGQRVG